ncbi:hypothetical protein [Agathobacter rectalis]|nr:hypothetical protein [Agathobacter rectalis]
MCIYYDELSEEELLKENMLADDIEQQKEYMEMQAMYEANELEI